jgi:hypothetical protein
MTARGPGAACWGSMTGDLLFRTGADPDRSSSFPETGHYPEVKGTFA